MKLSHVKSDFASKQAEDNTKLTRLSEIRRRAAEQKANAPADWSKSSFCEENKHGDCTWRECKCDCHRYESAMNDMFDYCGHC